MVTLLTESIDLGLGMQNNSIMEEMIVDAEVAEPLDPTDSIVKHSILSKVKHTNTVSVVIELEKENKLSEKLQQIVETETFGKAFKTPRGRRVVIEKVLPSKSSQVLLCKDVIGNNLSVLKVQKPAQYWEYYIYTRLSKSGLQPNVVSFGGYEDESILELEYQPTQTILSTFVEKNEINHELAFDIIVRIMKLVSEFHDRGFVHGDLNLSNIIIDETNGYKLIDFGATIDLNAFPKNQMFQMDKVDDEYECFEIQNGMVWKFEPDWYACALILHQLLFKDQKFKVLQMSELKRPVLMVEGEMDIKFKELFSIFMNIDSELSVKRFLSNHNF